MLESDERRNNGMEFEWNVAITLEALGYKIDKWPFSGKDRGIDIVVHREEAPIFEGKIMIQCKDMKVTDTPVMTFLGVLRRARSGRGFLITSNCATDCARKSAKDSKLIQLIEGPEWRKMQLNASRKLWRRIHNKNHFMELSSYDDGRKST